ncbi:MAG: AAA family ATPase [Bacteroidetes bacterium]|nr:AAA family ATPase [Bacteroidota bacterium]
MTNRIIIGRNEERQALAEMEAANGADMLAITGRRRVGKTYLVRTYFGRRLHFEFSGVLNADNGQQLQGFSIALTRFSGKRKAMAVPGNWMDAFHALTEYLDSLKKEKKLVVFIDELPWLDTHKSKFLPALDWFWNSWAVKKNILVIICGSAASWMANKIINNKGGLHNRVTRRIHLKPFTLSETEAFLKHNGVTLSRYHILQLYMTLGGVPHYLKEVKKGQSAAQNISRICFEKNGLLVNEFQNLYHALYKNADQHIRIIKALASKQKGLSRSEILKATKLKDGGTFGKFLEELEQADFIASYQPFGRVKKDMLYRLIDEYSLFYLKFMYNRKNINWMQLAALPVYKSWSGYAFENVCSKHINKIKAALGIAAVYTEEYSFLSKGSNANDGAQIDLLIDRNDNAINICEVKCYDTPFTISKTYAADLKRKLMVFQEKTQTKKSLFVILIAAYGIVPNTYSNEILQQVITMESLF